MGVDACFFVRPTIMPNEIITALKALGNKNVRYEHSQVAPDYLNIFFESKDGERTRMIHFHFNVQDSYFGMPCNLLSLRSDEESIEVFTQLAKIFGGILQQSDCTNDCEMFQVPGAGNIRWLLEQFFAKNPGVSEDSEVQLAKFAEWSRENEKSCDS